MQITHATILLTHGADLVILTTDLPSPMPKVSVQCLSIKFEVEADGGKDYIGTNFAGVPVNVLDTRLIR